MDQQDAITLLRHALSLEMRDCADCEARKHQFPLTACKHCTTETARQALAATDAMADKEIEGRLHEGETLRSLFQEVCGQRDRLLALLCKTAKCGHKIHSRECWRCKTYQALRGLEDLRT